MFNANWESYPVNAIFELSEDIARELQNLYMAFKDKKKNRENTAEKDYYIMLGTVIKFGW